VLDNKYANCEPQVAQAPPLLSDSGCSNDEEEEEFLDASEEQPKEAAEQFDLEINNDLDLAQIEMD
jgi:hypothetical protein